MDRHYIVFVERFGAVGTLSHTVGEPVVNALIAEGVATGFDSSVLEVVATNCA